MLVAFIVSVAITLILSRRKAYQALNKRNKVDILIYAECRLLYN